MFTPAQVAKRANLHSNTVRNYSRDYAELLSLGARGEAGPRLYTDEDVDTICTIAALRKSGMLPAAIVERIHADPAPPVVDVEPTQSPQTGYNALKAPEVAPTSLQAPYNTLQRDYVALQRRYETHLQHQLWTHGVAFYLGMVTMGLLFYFVWWLVNGW